MPPGVTLIAEVKTLSPFGFKSQKSWDQLFEIANKHGDIISIHTDPRWGGSFDLLQKARALTDKPILAKGIHASDEEVVEALMCGADYVLVVARTPRARIEKCWLEPSTLAQLRSFPELNKVVWNTRNLNTGLGKIESFDQARKTRAGWMCQASNIRTIADILPGADAVLVGQHLEEFITSL